MLDGKHKMKHNNVDKYSYVTMGHSKTCRAHANPYNES